MSMQARTGMSTTIYDGKTNFGKDSPYLQNNFVIELRREIAMRFLKHRTFGNVLDVGCGDGRISLEFMDKAKLAIMVDASPHMIEAAFRNLEERGLRHVETFCYNFEHESGIPEMSRYDLLICTGVLAHVENPVAVVDKLLSLASEQSLILLQNTDAGHPYTLMLNSLKKILRLIGFSNKKHNAVRTGELIRHLSTAGFALKERCNYVSSFPLIGRMLSKRQKYGINRVISGENGKSKLQFLGNESLLLFER